MEENHLGTISGTIVDAQTATRCREGLVQGNGGLSHAPEGRLHRRTTNPISNARHVAVELSRAKRTLEWNAARSTRRSTFNTKVPLHGAVISRCRCALDVVSTKGLYPGYSTFTT